MLGERLGFVFSLDSFVAFSLILIAIQSLVAISSAPAGYYHSFAQANFVAQDTMAILSNIRYDGGSSDLFGLAASAALNNRPSDARKLILQTNNLVPPPYSYAYDYYDFDDGQWHLIYNASKNECLGDLDFGHEHRFCNVSFNRVQAASTLFVGVYRDPIDTGNSPYCNVVCRGYLAYDEYLEPESCTKVPCDFQPTSTFDAGDYRLGMLRLRVWG